MEKIRDALDIKRTGIHDVPQLPIKILIDDIEQEVIEAEVISSGVPRRFIFRRKPYPPSHYTE